MSDPIETQLQQVDALTSEAIVCEQQENITGAIYKYQQAIGLLQATINGLNPSSPEARALSDHKSQLQMKLQQLQESLSANGSGVQSRNANAANPAAGLTLGQQVAVAGAVAGAAGTAQAATQQAGGVKTMAAAGAVGAVAGMVLLGPLGLLAGGAAAAYATTRGDAAGSVARGVGSGALSTAEKAKEIENKHHILEKTKSAAVATGHKISEINQQYKVTETIGNAASWVFGKVKETEQKYHVTDKVASGVSSGLSYVSNKMGGSNAPAAPGGGQ